MTASYYGYNDFLFIAREHFHINLDFHTNFPFRFGLTNLQTILFSSCQTRTMRENQVLNLFSAIGEGFSSLNHKSLMNINILFGCCVHEDANKIYPNVV